MSEPMRSRTGFASAATFIAAVPFSLLLQAFFAIDAEIAFHFAAAIAFVLVSLSVFDFETAKGIRLFGCASAGILAVIMFLQGLGPVLENETLTQFAFQQMGQRVEKSLTLLFYAWCAAVIRFDSRGKARIVGTIAISLVVCLEAYSLVLWYFGYSLNETAPLLKLFYVTPFIWLLFESALKRSHRNLPTGW